MDVVWGGWTLVEWVGLTGAIVAFCAIWEIEHLGFMDGGMFRSGYTTKRRRNWVYNYRVVLIVGGLLCFFWAFA